MTRASEMCSGCGAEIVGIGLCYDCRDALEPVLCPACSRLVRDDGSCGCSEGCAPQAPEALAWPTVLALVATAALLVWAVWSGVPT